MSWVVPLSVAAPLGMTFNAALGLSPSLIINPVLDARDVPAKQRGRQIIAYKTICEYSCRSLNLACTLALATLSYNQYSKHVRTSRLRYLLTATGFAVSVTVWSWTFNVPINIKLAALQRQLETRREDEQLENELVNLHHEWRTLNVVRAGLMLCSGVSAAIALVST